MAFSPDSKTLSVVSRDNTLKIWKIDGILLTTSNYIALGAPLVAYFSADGKFLAAFDQWNRVQFWKIKDNQIKQLKYLSLPTLTISRFSADAKTIALVTPFPPEDYRIRL